jgi:hypothetical protein
VVLLLVEVCTILHVALVLLLLLLGVPQHVNAFASATNDYTAVCAIARTFLYSSSMFIPYTKLGVFLHTEHTIYMSLKCRIAMLKLTEHLIRCNVNDVPRRCRMVMVEVQQVH